MSARLQRQGEARPGRLAELLRPPYAGYSPARLLAHFHTRTGIEYFPIIEQGETSRGRVDAVLENRFEFNGEAHRLPDPVPWLDNPSADIEWHILLHKFYYAVGLGFHYHRTRDVRYLRKWMSLTDSWLESAPPGFIAPDVTGRRVQNWIYAHHYFVTRNRPPELNPDFYARFLVSLHEQVDYLCGNLAPARNHRTLELHAIFLAAIVFPELKHASSWREFSLEEIAKNVAADLLPDGVHCELSTDYHHIVLRNLLSICRLARLNGIPIPAPMSGAIERALEFAMHVHNPLGEVPAFSDGDVRGYTELLIEGYELYGREDMLYVATRGARGVPPRERSRSFPAGGYCVVRGGWGGGRPFEDEHHLVFDCGPLGEGNHGHLDCLSFELAALGRRLIVDPGRYTYEEKGEPNWRALFRSTVAHNTVLVDGKNQTRYEPGPKRNKVRGPAPIATLHAWAEGPDFNFVHASAASHEYPVVHERRIFFVRPEYWIVTDVLRGEGEHRYDLLFHLAPEAQGRTAFSGHDGTLTVTAPGLQLAACWSDAIVATIDTGFVSERYGVKSAAPVVRFTRRAARAAFHTVVYPYRGEAPAIAVRELPVWRDDGQVAEVSALALSIRVGRGDAAVTDTWFACEHSARAQWRFANYRFEGSFLLVRKNAFGEIVRVHASGDSRLEEDGCRFAAQDLHV